MCRKRETICDFFPDQLERVLVKERGKYAGSLQTDERDDDTWMYVFHE